MHILHIYMTFYLLESIYFIKTLFSPVSAFSASLKADNRDLMWGRLETDSCQDSETGDVAHAGENLLRKHPAEKKNNNNNTHSRHLLKMDHFHDGAACCDPDLCVDLILWHIQCDLFSVVRLLILSLTF